MTGDRHDAEDLVQETLLRAWRARGTLADESMLRAWLYRIATRACLDELGRRPRSFHRAPLPQPIASSVHTGPEAHDPISGVALVREHADEGVAARALRFGRHPPARATRPRSRTWRPRRGPSRRW
ncbi:MAG TPA: sigma factor [Chloroflexota bacterium]|nr:sigma factor [Chloroflexota bacterium]